MCESNLKTWRGIITQHCSTSICYIQHTKLNSGFFPDFHYLFVLGFNKNTCISFYGQLIFCKGNLLALNPLTEDGISRVCRVSKCVLVMSIAGSQRKLDKNQLNERENQAFFGILNFGPLSPSNSLPVSPLVGWPKGWDLESRSTRDRGRTFSPCTLDVNEADI